LEEPMGETVFLLSTAQLHRLPATIKSRCQQLSIATPSIQQASQWLQTACPQSDSALIKRALRLNWGAPVAAKQWLDSGQFKQHNQWLEQVQAIVAGQAIINPCIDEWLKWPQPMRVLEYFYQATQSQIRQLGYQAQSQDTLALQSWLRFEHALGQAKLQWQGNANPTLIIENVLTLWLQINRHPEQAITLTGTPFESQMIRGEIG
jgi:DNA polymerase-3 subunit delta'